MSVLSYVKFGCGILRKAALASFPCQSAVWFKHFRLWNVGFPDWRNRRKVIRQREIWRSLVKVCPHFPIYRGWYAFSFYEVFFIPSGLICFLRIGFALLPAPCLVYRWYESTERALGSFLGFSISNYFPLILEGLSAGIFNLHVKGKRKSLVWRQIPSVPCGLYKVVGWRKREGWRNVPASLVYLHILYLICRSVWLQKILKDQGRSPFSRGSWYFSGIIHARGQSTLL